MTLQQWLFSFKGRIGRRDFWIWIALWIVSMVVLFSLESQKLLPDQIAPFALVCLLWPTAAVTVKRLHDRGRSGLWQWVVGRFAPTLILIMTLIDLGAFVGTQGENKYGKDTQDVAFKSAP